MADSLLEVCEILAEKEDLRVTVNGKAAFKAVGSFRFGAAGKVFKGSHGLLVAEAAAEVAAEGAADGVVTTQSISGRYSKVADVIRHDLTFLQRSKLEYLIKKIMDDEDIEDVATFLHRALTSASLKKAIINEIGVFLLNECSAKMLL